MTEFTTAIQGGSSAQYDMDLTQANGSNVLAAQVSDIVLTIVDEEENIVDSWDALSVKDANGGTVTDGHFTLVLDNQSTVHDAADPSLTQVRYMHFVITLVGGAVHVHEVLWYVQGNHIPGND